MLLTLNLYLVIDLFQPNNLYAQSRESSQLESQTRNMENKISRLESEVNKDQGPQICRLMGYQVISMNYQAKYLI